MDDFSYGALKYDAYAPRILDRHIAFALEDFGGVNIRGPKYRGKTWAGRASACVSDGAGGFGRLRLSPS